MITIQQKDLMTPLEVKKAEIRYKTTKTTTY